MKRATQVVETMHRRHAERDESLLDEKEVAALLGITPRALQKWRARRTGLRFIRLGRHTVRYRRDDVRRFIDERSVPPDEATLVR